MSPQAVLAVVDSLMEDTRACRCDRHDVPLCVACDCLFTVMAAAITWWTRVRYPRAALWQHPRREDTP